MNSPQATSMGHVLSIVRLLRPRQWIKNIFVFTGVLFGAQLRNPDVLRAAVLAAAAFSAMSSCIYVLNDYLDRESDRLHPTKRYRPLAAGTVTPTAALAVGLICFASSLAAAWAADPRVLAAILVYFCINVAYSARLKHEPVIDVFCIAAGFMLRIMAGTWGIHIPPSRWLILTGLFMTLFLGFAKRRAEWVDAGGLHGRRRVLSHYSQALLDSFLSITATGTVMSYGLYTLDAQTIAIHHTDKLIYTLPFVLFGLFRYLFILHRGKKGENPSVDVFTDRVIAANAAVYVGVAFWFLNR